MTVALEALDPTAASDDALRELHAFTSTIEREREPDDPIEPFDVAVIDYRDPPPWLKRMWWVARDGGDIVGAAVLVLEYAETNQHIAWFDIVVSADRRRAGIGSTLLDAVVAATRDDGRTVIGTTVVGPEAAGPDAPFLTRHGFDQRMVERRSRLLLDDVDRALMEEWIRRSKERASDYTLIGFDDVCPEDWLDGYVAVATVMNTAPREDLDMEDEEFTPERLAERLDRKTRRGEHLWTLIARHEPTGHFAGFTEVEFGDWMGDLAWQGGTGVDPAHRDKGLGRWLKATMALRLLEERPQTQRVDTWNAGSNRPMLGINVAMGFKPVRYYGDWQKNI